MKKEALTKGIILPFGSIILATIGLLITEKYYYFDINKQAMVFVIVLMLPSLLYFFISNIKNKKEDKLKLLKAFFVLILYINIWQINKIDSKFNFFLNIIIGLIYIYLSIFIDKIIIKHQIKIIAFIIGSLLLYTFYQLNIFFQIKSLAALIYIFLNIFIGIYLINSINKVCKNK
jgi:hypothetical protein